MKSSRDLSWRQKNANKHLPDELRERFVSKPKRKPSPKRRYEFRHGSWGDLAKLLSLAVMGFYFLFSLPAAVFWTFFVNNPRFTYQERTMVITKIMEHAPNSTQPNTVNISRGYLKRTARGFIDGKKEEVGLPPKLEHLKVGDRLKVAYCPERSAEGGLSGWSLRVLPMCSFENRKAYARNFLYAVWGPLALIGVAYLIKKIITAKRRLKREGCVRADPLTERLEK